MICQDDRDKFIQAEVPELDGLVQMDVFDLLPIKDNPPAAKLLTL
jgi:hypothetical protein